MLQSKKLLVIGEISPSGEKILKMIMEAGAEVRRDIKSNISESLVASEAYDGIIIENTEEDGFIELVKFLYTGAATKSLPIVAVLENDPRMTEQAFMNGVAECIFVSSEKKQILEKLDLLFGEVVESVQSDFLDISSKHLEATVETKRVFFVEDDSLLTNLLIAKLESVSFPYEFSRDGKDVVRRIRDFKPDVIILDIMLPEANGLEILKEIKEDAGIKSIPTFIFSNKDEVLDRDKASLLGASKYFVKSMTDLSDLITEIEQA